ncbi:MAG: N-acetylmuramoyl-L-alanine amidase [Lachnospiraceae bacterium]|jgi:glucan-binding YG repeat protein|nr:N-acetylmuramoyl-L-alanine amidase [Lachnospiraceae bacterium]
MKGIKKGFTAIMLCFLAFTWLMSAVRAEAASAPALEFIYADTSSEAGIERGKLIIASFQTGGQSITGAELTYEDRTGDTGRMAATEILEGYVAFLAQDRDLSGERLKELRIGYGGRTYTFDIQNFRNAGSTQVEQVTAQESADQVVENVVAENAGNIKSALRFAEQEAAEVTVKRGAGSVYPGTVTAGSLNRASGDIVVVLDPGHGGDESGAVRSWDGVDYIEKDITLKISRYTKKELEKYMGVKVYLTRTGDSTLSLEERVNYAAGKGATVLISQHINSTPQHESTATGAEVMVSSGNYDASQAAETANIARVILNELEKAGFQNRGLVYKLSETGNTYPNGNLADYYGIVRRSVLAGFPGMIVEHGFVSNPEDCKRYYGSNSKIKALGVADAKAIASYYGLKKKNLSGWNKEGKRWYYLNANGDRVGTGWLTLGSSKYYIDKSGYRMTGWHKIGGKQYFFGSDGVMQKGLLTRGRQKYWFTSKGVLKKGFFLGSDGGYRYANSKGVLYTGFKTYRGSKYYFHRVTGAALIGWRKIGKAYYYFSVTGKMQTGIVKVGREKYYLRGDGKRAVGWVNYNKKKYYFDRNTGAMVKGRWMKYKNKWFYLSKVGYAYKNTTKKINGKKYKFNEKGVCTNRRS